MANNMARDFVSINACGQGAKEVASSDDAGHDSATFDSTNSPADDSNRTVSDRDISAIGDSSTADHAFPEKELIHDQLTSVNLASNTNNSKQSNANNADIFQSNTTGSDNAVVSENSARALSTVEYSTLTNIGRPTNPMLVDSDSASMSEASARALVNVRSDAAISSGVNAISTTTPAARVTVMTVNAATCTRLPDSDSCDADDGYNGEWDAIVSGKKGFHASAGISGYSAAAGAGASFASDDAGDFIETDLAPCRNLSISSRSSHSNDSRASSTEDLIQLCTGLNVSDTSRNASDSNTARFSNSFDRDRTPSNAAGEESISHNVRNNSSKNQYDGLDLNAGSNSVQSTRTMSSKVNATSGVAMNRIAIAMVKALPGNQGIGNSFLTRDTSANKDYNSQEIVANNNYDLPRNDINDARMNSNLGNRISHESKTGKVKAVNHCSNSSDRIGGSRYSSESLSNPANQALYLKNNAISDPYNLKYLPAGDKLCSGIELESDSEDCDTDDSEDSVDVNAVGINFIQQNVRNDMLQFEQDKMYSSNDNRFFTGNEDNQLSQDTLMRNCHRKCSECGISLESEQKCKTDSDIAVRNMEELRNNMSASTLEQPVKFELGDSGLTTDFNLVQSGSYAICNDLGRPCNIRKGDDNMAAARMSGPSRSGLALTGLGASSNIAVYRQSSRQFSRNHSLQKILPNTNEAAENRGSVSLQSPNTRRHSHEGAMSDNMNRRTQLKCPLVKCMDLVSEYDIKPAEDQLCDVRPTGDQLQARRQSLVAMGMIHHSSDDRNDADESFSHHDIDDDSEYLSDDEKYQCVSDLRACGRNFLLSGDNKSEVAGNNAEVKLISNDSSPVSESDYNTFSSSSTSVEDEAGSIINMFKLSSAKNRKSQEIPSASSNWRPSQNSTNYRNSFNTKKTTNASEKCSVLCNACRDAKGVVRSGFSLNEMADLAPYARRSSTEDSLCTSLRQCLSNVNRRGNESSESSSDSYESDDDIVSVELSPKISASVFNQNTATEVYETEISKLSTSNRKAALKQRLNSQYSSNQILKESCSMQLCKKKFFEDHPRSVSVTASKATSASTVSVVSTDSKGVATTSTISTAAMPALTTDSIAAATTSTSSSNESDRQQLVNDLIAVILAASQNSSSRQSTGVDALRNNLLTAADNIRSDSDSKKDLLTMLDSVYSIVGEGGNSRQGLAEDLRTQLAMVTSSNARSSFDYQKSLRKPAAIASLGKGGLKNYEHSTCNNRMREQDGTSNTTCQLLADQLDTLMKDARHKISSECQRTSETAVATGRSQHSAIASAVPTGSSASGRRLVSAAVPTVYSNNSNTKKQMDRQSTALLTVYSAAPLSASSAYSAAPLPAGSACSAAKLSTAASAYSTAPLQASLAFGAATLTAGSTYSAAAPPVGSASRTAPQPADSAYSRTRLTAGSGYSLTPVTAGSTCNSGRGAWSHCDLCIAATMRSLNEFSSKTTSSFTAATIMLRRLGIDYDQSTLCHKLNALVHRHHKKPKPSSSIRAAGSTSALIDYLFSISSEGISADELLRCVKSVTQGGVCGRFLNTNTLPQDFNLKAWFNYWMSIEGAALMITISLPMTESTVSKNEPRSWRHLVVTACSTGDSTMVQLSSGSSTQLTMTLNDLLAYLTSEPKVMIEREAVLTWWTEDCDLNALLCASDSRWRHMNVLGQVVNVLRERQMLMEGALGRYKPQQTSHISLPTHLKPGITLYTRRASPAYLQLKTCANPLHHIPTVTD